MSSNSNIEWTEATWNPVVGCTRVSAGCDHCYAAAMTRRLEAMGQQRYAGLSGRGHFNGVVRCVPEVLDVPLRRKKPTVYFVNSMSDLFHPAVPFDFIDRVFAVMALCPQHTFQLLTKRPQRMAEYVNQAPHTDNLQEEMDRLTLRVEGEPFAYNQIDDDGHWPLPNIWLGTSVENQAAADERIPHLLRCPAAVRFLSCEPLLGRVELRLIDRFYAQHDAFGRPPTGKPIPHPVQIDWIIVGCESRGGHVGRLLCDPHTGGYYQSEDPARDEGDWWAAAESIYTQCRDAGVAFFCKQGPYMGRVSHEPANWMLPLPREMPTVNTEEVAS